MPKSDGEKWDEVRGRERIEHMKDIKELRESKKKKQEEEDAAFARAEANAKLPDKKRPDNPFGGIDDWAETEAGDTVDTVPDAPPDPPLPVDTVPEVPSGLKLTKDEARELVKATEEAGGFNAALLVLKSAKDIKPDLQAYLSKGRSRSITISLNPRDFQRLDEIQNFVCEKQGQRIVVSKAVKIAIRLAKITEDNIFKVTEAIDFEDKRRSRKRRKARKR